MVSAADPHSRYSQFSRPEPLLFFQVAPHLSSRGVSGPRSRPTATQKIEPGTFGLAARNSDH
jgi:hypothetical protein